MTRMLQETLEQDKLSHAYLFWGPSGVGKKTTVQALARAVLGLTAATEETWPEHPDFLVIAPQEEEKSIGKNLIAKTLIPWLGIRPYQAKQKIAVIGEAQRMTPEASNALLKILEEPPLYGVIILLADRLELLETIISRCQCIRFSALREETLVSILCSRGLSQEEAQKVSSISGGNAHLALRFHPAEMEGQWQTAEQLLRQLAGKEKSGIFSAAAAIEKNPVLLTAIMIYLRDLFIYQETGQTELLLLPEKVKALPPISASRDKISLWWEAQALYQQQTSNVNKQMLYVNICFKLHHMLTMRAV